MWLVWKELNNRIFFEDLERSQTQLEALLIELYLIGLAHDVILVAFPF